MGSLPKAIRLGHKFIPHFSEIAAPVSDLTRKKEPESIRWTPECHQAFDQLKEVLTTGPVSAPDYTREFTIFTDASNVGLGVVLCQADGEGTLHPVTYIQ